MFFQGRRYASRVIRAAQNFGAINTDEQTALPFVQGLFRHIKYLDDRKIMNINVILSVYYKNDLSIDEGALSLIDGTVSNLKGILNKIEISNPGSWTGKNAEDEDRVTLLLLITHWEGVIDSIVTTKSVRVVPENGKHGKEFRDAGLDKFTSKIR